ncbi:hypothetical protein CANARDRAFT_189576, partial [[Candida] arabinofermentans NRRL YB-2248]
KKQPWKKLLWFKQDYADNYTDSSFLSQLKRNSTVVNYSYWKVLSDFTLIVLHLSIIMSVILVFYGLYQLEWNPLIPTLISSSFTVMSFITYVITLKIRRNRELINLQKQPNPPNLFNTMKSSILILLTLLTFSPVLKSLTNSTASDSIWALSAWLCILNVLFNDYSIDFNTPHRHHQLGNAVAAAAAGNSDSYNLEMQNSNSNLSKNISLSNAIVLASRLNSNLSAFCFIVFSIEVSGLFPIFNNFTRRCQFTTFHWFQVFGIVLGVDYTIYRIFGIGWFLVWVSIHFWIAIVGPWYFIALQKYKDELQGPWDPAKPTVNSS